MPLIEIKEWGPYNWIFGLQLHVGAIDQFSGKDSFYYETGLD